MTYHKTGQLGNYVRIRIVKCMTHVYPHAAPAFSPGLKKNNPVPLHFSGDNPKRLFPTLQYGTPLILTYE